MEEQIIGIQREKEAGAKAGELARKHGVSEGASVLRNEGSHNFVVAQPGK